jgi:hypothetical protein
VALDGVSGYPCAERYCLRSYVLYLILAVRRRARKVTSMRDSVHPYGAMLRFTPAEWNAFIDGIRAGEVKAVAR